MLPFQRDHAFSQYASQQFSVHFFGIFDRQFTTFGGVGVKEMGRKWLNKQKRKRKGVGMPKKGSGYLKRKKGPGYLISERKCFPQAPGRLFVSNRRLGLSPNWVHPFLECGGRGRENATLERWMTDESFPFMRLRMLALICCHVSPWLKCALSVRAGVR